MTEFLAACLVLIPVFLAIPLLGKYMDIDHAAVQGARYLAWERTVWTPEEKSNARLENELRKRIFTRPGEKILASDHDGSPASYNPLWTDFAGKPMLAKYGDVTGQTEASPGQATPGLIYNDVVSKLLDAYNVVMGWLEKIGHLDTDNPPKFQINVNGMYSGTIHIKVAEQGTAGGSGTLPSLLYVGALDITPRPNVIVTDPWNVSGPGSGYHCKGQDPTTELCQDELLVPTTVLSGWFQDLTNTVGYIIPEFKPEKDGENRLDFGRIVPSVAPKEKKKP